MEMLFWIVGGLVLIWAGFMLGWMCRGVHIMLRISQDPDSMRRLIDEVQALDLTVRNQGLAEGLDQLDTGKEIVILGPNIIMLKPEWRGGICYLFTEDGDQFVGQGSTIEAALVAAQAGAKQGKVMWVRETEQESQTA